MATRLRFAPAEDTFFESDGTAMRDSGRGVTTLLSSIHVVKEVAAVDKPSEKLVFRDTVAAELNEVR